MKLSGICLITDDVQRLVAFYTRVLRATSTGNEVHSEVEVQGSSFAIYSREAAVRDMKFSFPEKVGCGDTVLMFSVDDVDIEYERLKSQNVRFLTVPTTYPWGNRAVHFWDPDGNIVDFYTPPN